jgi:indolepyruvate ferredoxin oxidoreductase alpha subunit
MSARILMLGNEAIARGLVESGCSVAASYPGTPASEILSSAVQWRKACGVPMHIQWAVNEKVALEIAYTASITGLRSAVSMKQVGLNVASDPLMSAAYTGVVGGFLVISADDPGPHSSQTEQDSRLMAMMAKVPVLDPASPAHARDLVEIGYEISEIFRIPVMLRPTTRVCHACQDILPGEVRQLGRKADFKKTPARWAATPAFRFELHRELAGKLKAIAAWPRTAPARLNPHAEGRRAVVASGVAAAHAGEILLESGLWDRLPIYRVVQPFPLHTAFIAHLFAAYEEILVLEETAAVIEMQLLDRRRVRGRMTGTVPEAGELLPEIVERLIAEFAGLPVKTEGAAAKGGGRRPTLCAGCPHRSSFYAIKKAAPRGIYPSDIGCYTLGLNLGGVDTVLCMGAAVSQAAGFYQAYRLAGKPVDIVATIGDSTFYHAGVPPLIDAVVQGARFVLVILDNSTTAMTGFQATPATGIGAAGEPTGAVDMESLVRGCGVEFCKVGTPSRLPEFTGLLKEAVAFSHEHGPAVVIAREPCVMDRRQANRLPPRRKVRVNEECDGCRHCTEQFECPALVYDEGGQRVFVDTLQCTGCGVCLHVCPRGAIVEEGPGGGNP